MWRLFMHLDGGVVCNQRMSMKAHLTDFRSLTSSSLLSFYEIVYCAVQNQVRDCILQVLEDDRNGDEVCFENIKESVEVFHV